MLLFRKSEYLFFLIGDRLFRYWFFVSRIKYKDYRQYIKICKCYQYENVELSQINKISIRIF